jgi:hypothetical protein
MTTIRYEEMIRDKLHFYSDKGIPIHLTLQLKEGFTRRPFRNGQVVKYQDNSIIFMDRILGEVLIFLSEITDVQKMEGSL